jgi:hypothetical protein
VSARRLLKTSCPPKRALLNEYLRKADITSVLTREYAEALACGSSMAWLSAVKDRIEKAKAEYLDARKYADHCGEHGC